MTTAQPAYLRSPSKGLKDLLSPRGFLAPLIDLNRRQVAGLELDVHLRVNDEVHVYCGLSRLLRVRLNKRGSVRVLTGTYREQDCAEGLDRTWKVNEAREFKRALDSYLCGVGVGREHIDGEGSVQSLWSRVRQPWVPFDREALLSYSSQAESRRARDLEPVALARAELDAIVEDRRRSRTRRNWWVKVPRGGREVDQLAVDSEGSLVLLELKVASANQSSVYYTPFQLLQYVWEWYCALESVRPQLQALLSSRVELGLTPGTVPRLTGGIQAAVCFDRDNRSPEVRRRYSEVLQVVNRFLPAGVSPVETWALEYRPEPAQLSG